MKSLSKTIIIKFKVVLFILVIIGVMLFIRINTTRKKTISITKQENTLKSHVILNKKELHHVIKNDELSKKQSIEKTQELDEIIEAVCPSNNKTMSEISLENYAALITELDANLVEYRNSKAMYAKFSNICARYIVPLAIESEKAGIWLAEARQQGTHNYSESNYDKAKANEIIMKILATICKDVYEDFYKEIETGHLTFSNKQEEIFFRGCYHHFNTETKLLSEPFEKYYPYAKNTVEHKFFIRDLGQAAIMATSPLGKLIYQIPSELKNKQLQLNELREQLIRQGKNSKTNISLLEEYKESYIKKLEEESSKIGRISEFHREMRSDAKHSLDDALDVLDSEF